MLNSIRTPTLDGKQYLDWAVYGNGVLQIQIDSEQHDKFQYLCLSKEDVEKLKHYLSGTKYGTRHKIDSIFDLKKMKKDNKKVVKMFRKLRKELKKSFR